MACTRRRAVKTASASGYGSPVEPRTEILSPPRRDKPENLQAELEPQEKPPVQPATPQPLPENAEGVKTTPKPASLNPKSDAVKKTAETPGKAAPKETYFGPSAEELKKIQTEEAAGKAASFRKWLERKKKAGGTAW